MPRTLAWGCALALAVMSPAATGQAVEYELNEAGEWVPVAAPEPDEDQATIAEARRLIASDRAALARHALDAWIARHRRSAHPLLAEAYLLRGDALTLGGYEYKALYDYEQVIRDFPGSEQFTTAIQRELEIGVRYVHGLRRRMLGMRIVGSSDVGEELLVRVYERLPGSRLAERAALELGDYYFRTGDLDSAAETYKHFINAFPTSAHRRLAMERRIHAVLGAFKGPKYDGSKLLEARLLLEDHLRLYPGDAGVAEQGEALLARIEESAAAEMLSDARYYLSQGDEPAARLMLRRLHARHAGTVAGVRARELMESRGWLDEEPALPGSAPSGDPGTSEREGGVPAEGG